MQRGSLSELRPGVWRYRVGKPARSRTFQAPNLKAAQVVATKVQGQWDDQAAAGEKLTPSGSVAKLVADWRAFRDGKDSPATIYRRQAITNRIVTDLGHIQLIALNARDLDHWYVQLGAGRGKYPPLSPSTVRHYHRVLRAILYQGWKWDMVPTIVADKASPPVAVKRDQSAHMPTVEALQVMLATASRSVRMSILLAVTTGCRRGELVALRWSDLNGDMLTVSSALVKVPGKPIVRKATKTETVRTMKLPATTVAVLATYRQQAADYAAQRGVAYAIDGPIIAHQRHDPTGGTPFAPEWLSQEWDRLCAKHDVTGLKLHGLRHLQATLLANANTPMATTQKRQGHSSMSTTMDYYVHPVDAADLEAVAVLEAVVAPLAELGRT